MSKSYPWTGTPLGLILVSLSLPVAVLVDGLFWVGSLSNFLKPPKWAADTAQIPAEIVWWFLALASGHYLLRNRKLGFYLFLIFFGSWLYGSMHGLTRSGTFDGWFWVGIIVPLIYLVITLPVVWKHREQMKD